VPSSELPLLTSPALPAPFRHGFTTRAGGVSAPPFDSLNLGVKWGDSREAVEENRARVLRASGARVLAFARQVHGARVLTVTGDTAGAEEADALCSDRPDVAVAVFVADCVPVLIVDPRTGAFAAAHAGWRGTVSGVLRATVTTLKDDFGSRPADLRAALGPAIGPCCFEVGPEVAVLFPASVIRAGAGKPHVDLRAHQRRQLIDLGLDPAGIDVMDACTRCDPAGRFFSFRRDQARTGMHVGFVGRPVTSP
jgi:YfiH family protein